ncbi:MAG TPA: alpha-L-fucosidase [Candidatus Acidoferrum sp.]|nr:alpha-L-fucosidase [Candidatus Acidoferrum sp.]
MHRRTFVKLSLKTFLGASALLISASLALSQNFVDVKPSPQQVAWQDLEFGVIIHFGPNTFMDREWGDGSADPGVFNPTAFDPEQWMRSIKAAGAKYVVMVAKHHDGFCLWPTEQTSYSVKNSPWKNGKGDVVAEVAAAARKYDLRFGVYLSPWDRHEPRYSNSAEYDKYYAAELDELAQHYGELTEFWLDGAGSAGHVYNFPHIIEELRTYQPNTLVFADTGLFEYGDIRWVGNEAGVVASDNWNVIDRHGYLRWRPAEADTPLRKLHWFWHPHDEASLKSLSDLLTLYDQTIGRGGQLMLGLAPDNRGLLPENDTKRLEEFGAAIANRYGSTKNLSREHVQQDLEVERALDNNVDTFWSAPPNSHHSTLEVNFAKPVTFDHALIMERLANGQHVQSFRIEVWDGAAWKSVAAAHSIGHKRIESFPAQTASKVRLNILSSTDAAEITEFQLFSIADR